MVWPFSRIKALENQVEELKEARKDDGVLFQTLERNNTILRERNAAQAKEIVDLKLLVDELRGQVHSATTQLAKKEGQLQQALKNDSRDPKGRYVGTTVGTPQKPSRTTSRSDATPVTPPPSSPAAPRAKEAKAKSGADTKAKTSKPKKGS